MSCRNNCRLCKKLIISTAVTYTAPNLIVTIPAGSYQNSEKYCIVVAQTIPSTTTLDAPVFVQIGTGTELYPLTRCNCAQVTARTLRTRTKYSTRVHTTPTTGTFRLLSDPCRCNNVDNDLIAIDGTAPVAPTPTPGA